MHAWRKYPSVRRAATWSAIAKGRIMPARQPRVNTMKQVLGACPHDCPDTCAWQVTVDDDGRASQVHGTQAHPFTQGALCAKLKRYPERVYSAQRILHPLRRSGAKGRGSFTRISWDEALSEIVTRLKRRHRTTWPAMRDAVQFRRHHRHAATLCG